MLLTNKIVDAEISPIQFQYQLLLPKCFLQNVIVLIQKAFQNQSPMLEHV